MPCRFDGNERKSRAITTYTEKKGGERRGEGERELIHSQHASKLEILEMKKQYVEGKSQCLKL